MAENKDDRKASDVPEEQESTTQTLVVSKGKLSSPKTIKYVGSLLALVIVVIIIVILAGNNNNASGKPAITDQWTGKGQNNNWSNAANWSRGVPKSNDSLVFNTDIAGTKPGTTNNDLNGVTFESIKFINGAKDSHEPYSIVGQSVHVSSGGVAVDCTNYISIHSLVVDSNTTLSSTNKTRALVSLGLNLNGNNLTSSNSVVALNSLSGGGNLVISSGELEFVSSDKSNPGFSGSITVNSPGQISITPSSGLLGSGTLGIGNGAQLLFRLKGNATFTSPISFGGSTSNSIKPMIQATSDVLSKNSSNTSFNLTLSGKITLQNDTIYNTSSSNNGLVPVKLILTHKPGGNYKVMQSSNKVIVSQP